MIGRIAFWLLLPGLIATLIELSTLWNIAFGPSSNAEPDRLGALIVFVFVLVTLGSMTFQALLLVRRPQSLTARQLPTAIATTQFALYAVLALWVALLATVAIGALSVLFSIAVMGLSIALLVQIIGWRAAPSERATDVQLPTPLWLALCGYLLVALVGLMYAIASSFTPNLDPGANQAFFVLVVLGVPLSVLVWPVVVIALLAGFTLAFTVVAAVPVLANIAAVLLLLWPKSRVRLVNWFFKLGRSPKPDPDAIAEH